MDPFRLKGASGPLLNRSFPFRERLTIGRADDCDLRLDEDHAAAHHAEVLRLDDGSLVIRPLADGAEIFLNGQPVAEHSLVSGDELRIGTSRLILQAPGLRPQRVLHEAGPRRGSRWWVWLALAALAAAGWVWWQGGYQIGPT